MAGLFSHRLHFLIGKGGVGKTSVVTALALATSWLGKRTLLIELAENTWAAHN
jgi:anion-transporting  ArsA/GET3 family ATPase